MKTHCESHNRYVHSCGTCHIAEIDRLESALAHVLTYGLIAHMPKHSGPSNCTACGIEAWLQERGIQMPRVVPSATCRAQERGTP